MMNQLEAMKETMTLAEDLLIRYPHPHEFATGSMGIKHLREMLATVLDDQTKAPQFRMSPAKLGRWLGWMQCAVYAIWCPHVTLETFKQLNMRHSQDLPPPEDGTVIVASTIDTYRFKQYKPGSQEKKNGKEGRWQKLNEYGGWENSSPPATPWSYAS